MKWLLLGLSVFFLGLRFFDLSSTPFINDEPQLQLLSQKAVQTHTIAKLGLEGTRGVTYGPTAVWFYSALRLVSPDLTFQLIIFAGLTVIAFLILTFLMSRTFGEESAGYFLALTSTSPLLTFYSRQLWDNTLQIFLWSLVLLLVFYISLQKKTLLCLLCLSVVLGLLFNLHLMCVASIAFTAFWVGKRNLKWGRFAACSFLFLWVTFPYLTELFKMKHQASIGTSWPGQPIRVLLSALTQFSVFYSSQGISFVFDGLLDRLHNNLGNAYSMLFQWDPSPLFTFLVFLALYRIYRSPEKHSFKGFVALMGPLCVLYYALIGLSPVFPHYFGTVWYSTPFCLGYWLTQLKGKWLFALRTVLLITIMINAILLMASYRFIKTNSGTRGDRYGTVYPELKRVSENICHLANESRVSQITLDLHLVPGVILPSLKYFITNLRGCESLPVLREDNASARFRLEYKTDSKDNAELVVIDSGNTR